MSKNLKGQQIIKFPDPGGREIWWKIYKGDEVTVDDYKHIETEPKPADCLHYRVKVKEGLPVDWCAFDGVACLCTDCLVFESISEMREQ